MGQVRLHARGLAVAIGVYHVGTELRRLVCGTVGQAFEQGQGLRVLYEAFGLLPQPASSETKILPAQEQQGRMDIAFRPPINMGQTGISFTEGNGWQYYWYVPQNIPDLIGLTGGEDAFCKRLDEFFTSDQTSGEKNDNASGFVGPCMPMAMNLAITWPIFMPWPANRPRPNSWWTISNVPLYNTSSSGYAGNDDCGEMSAWYVFSALGFYPVNPASGEYVDRKPHGGPCGNHAVRWKEVRHRCEA